MYSLHHILLVFEIFIRLFGLYHLNLFELLSGPLVPSILADAQECGVLAHELVLQRERLHLLLELLLAAAPGGSLFFLCHKFGELLAGYYLEKLITLG
jgi:hypothetical protein